MPSRPDHPFELFRQGRLQEAEACCTRALRKRPGHAAALDLLGLIRLKQRRRDEAIGYFRRAVDAAPMVVAHHEHLAEACHRAGRRREAERACRVALRLEPNAHRTLDLLGRLALERGDHEEAIRHLSASLDARMPNLPALIDLSVVMNRTGDHEMASRYCRLALQLAPKNPLAWTNLGLAYKGMRRLAEAKQSFIRAGDFLPARFNLGYTYLLGDDLVRGLPLYETRKKLLGIGRGLRRPEWDGRPRPGDTLLVTHEQGMGDTLLMCRFYAQLLDSFRHVVVLVQPALARLIATVSPGIEVVTSLEGVRYDRWCATMSLPLKLGITTVDQIPNEPWLSVHDDIGLRVRRPGRLRVGLNWAGNPSFAYDAVRSTHLDALATLLQVRDVEWCSLHRGHLEHEAETFGLAQPLREARDFHDTAGVVQDLDLVISTETAVPNLSAALGVRTCILASGDVDWRWRSWYPNVTVCEQQSPGNWFGPVAGALEVIREEIVAAQRAA